MTQNQGHIRPLFLIVAVAAGIVSSLLITYFVRDIRTKTEITRYASEIELSSERVSWELSLFFERLYNATGMVLYELRHHGNLQEAAPGLRSPYIQSQLRAVSSRISLSITTQDGTTLLSVMGETCPNIAGPDFRPFDDVAFRSLGDSSGIGACSDGEEYLGLVRRIDDVPWLGHTVLVANIPVRFFEDILRRNAGYRFAVQFALLDAEGKITIRQELRGTSPRPSWGFPASLAVEIATSGGTKHIDKAGFIGSSRQISGYPATILVLADKKEVGETARKDLGFLSFLIIPASALAGLLGALVYELFRLTRHRTRLKLELQRETDFLALLEELRGIYDNAEDEDRFIRQALFHTASVVPNFTYILEFHDRIERGGADDPELESGDEEKKGRSSIPGPAKGPSKPRLRHYMTAVIEDDTASRGRISFAGDEVCMSRAMAEQLRDFLVKHYTIISSNRKLSLSLKEKEEMLDELRRWQNVMLGRESRIIELKYEVNELLARTGLPPRYTEEV